MGKKRGGGEREKGKHPLFVTHGNGRGGKGERVEKDDGRRGGGV